MTRHETKTQDKERQSLFNVKKIKREIDLLLLQFQTSLGFHDVFDDEFRGGISSREVIYGFDHLLVRNPFILESLGTTVIDVVYLGNLVQTIDTGISSCQSFLQMRAGSHVLIAWPMKLDPRLPQPFLNIDARTRLTLSTTPPPPPPRRRRSFASSPFTRRRPPRRPSPRRTVRSLPRSRHSRRSADISWTCNPP